MLPRGRITGLLWPDKGEEQARHILSVSAYELRKELGEDALVGRGEDVVLDPLALRSDVEEFEAALDRGDPDAAIALYRGPFLDGFVLGGSADFEHWVDAERERLARRHRDALVARAEALASTGDLAGAADAWRMAANADRFDSRIAVRLLAALDAAGNRAGALQFARIHEALIRQEFGTDPDPAFTAAVERVRARTEPTPSGKERTEPDTPGTAGQELDTPGNEGTAAKPSPMSPTSPIPASPRTPPYRRPLLRAAAVILPIVAGAALLMAYLAGREPVRVAVLPFGTSGDSALTAFADGLAEQILDNLAMVEGVEVPAWSAVAALRGVDVREAVQQLGVDYGIEGSVYAGGDSLRINVRLVSPDGITRWKGSHDRPAREVFRTWDEITLAVLDTLEVRLGTRTLPSRVGGTDSYAALQLFMRGREAWNRRSPGYFQYALEYFRQAIELDPNYARAYAGMADAYNVMGAYDYAVLPPDSAFPVAMEYARKAIALAPELGEAHAALAAALASYDRDWDAADASYRRALRYLPHYAEGHYWYSLFLLTRGEVDASIERARHALSLDSLSAVLRSGIGRHLYLRGEPAAALDWFRRAVEVDPAYPQGHIGVGTAFLQLERPDSAVAAFERALAAIGRPHPLALGLLGQALARDGRPDSARAILASLTRFEHAADGGAYVPHEAFALIHVGLGENDAAIDRLARALEARSASAPYFGLDPLVRPLWDDPRFRKLIERGQRPVAEARR